MLHNLYVKNLALIDEIDIEFQKGLNILTGETGAGKSIILGSINLALGGRYSSDILRSEEEPGYVELTFMVKNPYQIQLLKENDIYLEDGFITLSRKMIGKRSVSKINGETVSISQLKEIAEILIDIHGQHEHQSLLYKKHHLSIVDEYAKDLIKEVKDAVASEYLSYKKIKHELEDSDRDVVERNKEISLLEFEIQEIQNANLKPQEDEMLEEQYKRMLNGQKITSSIEEAYGYTASGNGNASDALSRAIHSLSDAVRYDDKAEMLYEQLAEVDNLLNDFNRDLADYRESFEFSEEEFYEVESRLNEINRLKAKYGNSVEDILNVYEDKTKILEKLQNFDQYIAELKNQLKESETVLKRRSDELTKIRRAASKELAESIKQHLLELNFLDVKFDIVFEQLQTFTDNGVDEVEFLISTNPGEPIKPLTEVASGGELSRIMLAIKTVMAEKDQIETLIFDEIDVGISGRTAQKVSEKMALIGQTHQVICITHLAQIAAMADAHYAIEKNVIDGKTKTQIKLLNKDQEINELARILGGAEITETVLKSAAEMKDLAKSTRLN